MIQKNNKFFHFFILTLLTLTQLACTKSTPPPPPIQHIIICWLKSPGNTDQRQQLIDQTKKLKAIPGIKAITVGQPLPSNRPIVDSSFDVGIVMAFANQEALEAYQKNPIHLKALKEILLPLTSKVLIYDFVGE